MRSVLGSRASIGGVLGQGRGGASNGLLTGLVAYWKMDEASGDALDAHTNGLTMTQSGTVGSGTGHVYATARTFDGATTNFLYSLPSATFSVGDIDFAWAAWVYVADKTTLRPIIAQYNTLVAQRSTMMTYSNSLSVVRATVTNGATENTVNGSDISTTAWHLCVYWHDATANKIYIQIDNGTIYEQAHSAGAASITTAFAIYEWRFGALGNGTVYNSYRWNGMIGPVAFWKNRTLSADDRSALYNGGAGLAYSAFTA